MRLKPGAKLIQIREQVIEDPASGLTLVFDALPNGTARLRICGDALPFGNRDLIFGPGGTLGGTGTAPGGACAVTWLREVKD